MNKVNDYETLLGLANEDLANPAFGKTIILEKDEDSGTYNILIQDSRNHTECFSGNHFEDELSDVINDAWGYAKAVPKKRKTKAEKEDDIRTLFGRLSSESKASLLAEFYQGLPDYWKDRFLEKTGNA